MRSTLARFAIGAFSVALSSSAQGQNLLSNGNLDRVHDVEIVPGFFLPKPDVWENIGTRSISGPYEDEMSSEPWSGPAPTPVTTDGLANPAPYNSPPGDWGVFFKPFSGSVGPPNGLATGHLQQAVPGLPGSLYTLTGWAGCEANFIGGAQFAIDFLDGGGMPISSATLDLIAAGLFDPNGEPFNYKQYTVMGMSPAGTVSVRARASMIDAFANPAGGGQAYVIDDFVLTPEPSTMLCCIPIALSLIRRRR